MALVAVVQIVAVPNLFFYQSKEGICQLPRIFIIQCNSSLSNSPPSSNWM